MRERVTAKLMKTLKNEEEKSHFGGVTLPENKLYLIDKMVRRKLQDKLQDGNYSDLIDPLVNEKYEVLGLGQGPDEAENPSLNVDTGKPEERKGGDRSNVSPANESKEGQKDMQKINEIIDTAEEKERKRQEASREKGQTYEEWLYRKEAEGKYLKMLLEAEKEELRKMEEEKEEEKKVFEEQKYYRLPSKFT